MMKRLFGYFIIATLFAVSLVGCGEKMPDSPEADGGSPVEETTIDPYVFYEANPRLFASSNQLKAVTARLDEIKALGVNVIWLMPIYEQGQDAKAIGSPYCIKDFKKVNPEYGTLEDLKALVAAAHERDIYVILDWIANHTSWDNAWIANDGWYTTDGSGNILSPSGWSDVADLNFNNSDMRQAMLDAMKYWVNEADVDGFRCDYAEGVPADFWTNTIKSLRAEKGGLIMLAEANVTSLFDAGFDLMYAWGFSDALQSAWSVSGTVSALYEAYRSDVRNTPEGKRRMRYILNHDTASENSGSAIERFGSETGAMAAFVAATFLEGCPMIYSSQEVGYSKPLSFFATNKTVLDWNSNSDYTDEYKKVMKAYTESAGIRVASPKLYDMGNAVAIYYSNAAGDGLFVIVNSKNTVSEVNVPMERRGDKAKDMLTGEALTLSSVLSLDSYEYKILKIEK